MRRSEETDGLDLTTADATASCVRAFGHAIGNVVPLEDMAPAERERWYRAVTAAMDWLPTMDGRPISEGVSRITSDYAGEDTALCAAQAPYRAEWEAVVRHLNCLMDSDEIENEADVQALESSWADWVRRRRPKVEVS